MRRLQITLKMTAIRRGRLRRRRTGEGSASEVDRGGFSVGGGAGWSRGKAEKTVFLRRRFFDDLRKIVFSAIYRGLGKRGEMAIFAGEDY